MALSNNDIVEKIKEDLRNQKNKTEIKPSVENVKEITSDLINGISFEETFKKMPGKTQKAQKEFTLSVIAKFGTWLSHVEGSIKTNTLTLDMDLLDIIEHGGNDTESVEITLPDGYAPKKPTDRDVTNSIASIIAHNPENTAIERFVARSYRTRSTSLTYPLVAGVWMFCSLNRLHNIDKVSSDSIFREKVVAAYSLLNVAIEDANESVNTILTSDIRTDSRKVIKACIKSRWIFESLFKELEETLRNRNYTKADSLIQHIVSRKGIIPQTVSDLSASNIRKICEYAGISVEHEERVNETQIRSKLKSLGFAKDSDYLLPDALRAHRLGKESEFWDILELRSANDSSWVSRLEDLIE